MHTPEGALKLSASPRAKHAAPFQTHTVLALPTAHPFILFLTFSRFLSEAAVLHCRRHLAVYKQPEVRLASGSFHTCNAVRLPYSSVILMAYICARMLPSSRAVEHQRRMQSPIELK
jgi:hypothetical protein